MNACDGRRPKCRMDTVMVRLLALLLVAASVAPAWARGADCPRSGPADPCCAGEPAGAATTSAEAPAAKVPMRCCTAGEAEGARTGAPAVVPPAPRAPQADVVEAGVVPTSPRVDHGLLAVGTMAAGLIGASLFLQNRSLRN